MALSESQKVLAGHVIRGAARIVLLLLTIRVAILLMAPSADDQRVAWFLAGTEPLEDPFRPLVRNIFMDPWSGSILDTVALAAIICIALIEAILVRAIWWERPVREPMPPMPPELLKAAPIVGVQAPPRPPATPETVQTVPVTGEVRRVTRD